MPLLAKLNLRRKRRGQSAAARRVASWGVNFGSSCRFIKPTTTTFGSEPYLVRLGDHVTVGEGVRFITHDGGVWVLRDRYLDLDVIAPIVVGDNVFIGSGATILPGVSVGDDVVIAAASVVTRDVERGVVVAGVPARKVTSLADYEKRSVSAGVGTKAMPPAAKKEYLRKLFRDRLEG